MMAKGHSQVQDSKAESGGKCCCGGHEVVVVLHLRKLRAGSGLGGASHLGKPDRAFAQWQQSARDEQGNLKELQVRGRSRN